MNRLVSFLDQLNCCQLLLEKSVVWSYLSNEPSGSVKGNECLDQLNCCQLLLEKSVVWSYLSNEPSGSVKGNECLDQLSNC
jgi:hypothetical protein